MNPAIAAYYEVFKILGAIKPYGSYILVPSVMKMNVAVLYAIVPVVIKIYESNTKLQYTYRIVYIPNNESIIEVTRI